MPMNYQNNIPQSTDQISQSQSDILNNFATVDAWVNIDHGPLNAAAGLQGTHYKVTMPVQGAAPAPFVNPTTTNGMYTLNYTPTGKSETYIRKQNQATTVDIPMTASILGTGIVAGPVAGWTYLPSGILMKWGFATCTPAGGNINVNSGNNFGPNFTAILVVQCTPTNSQATVFVTNDGVNNINIRCSNTQSVSFLIIGY